MNKIETVTTNMNLCESNIETLSLVSEKEECKCCGENSLSSQLVVDDTSIYEYDCDCLKRKQKEL